MLDQLTGMVMDCSFKLLPKGTPIKDAAVKSYNVYLWWLDASRTCSRRRYCHNCKSLAASGFSQSSCKILWWRLSFIFIPSSCYATLSTVRILDKHSEIRTWDQLTLLLVVALSEEIYRSLCWTRDVLLWELQLLHVRHTLQIYLEASVELFLDERGSSMPHIPLGG